MRMSIPILVLFTVAACDIDSTEPVTRNQAGTFQMRATWQASVTPMGATPITGSLNIKDFAAYYEGEMSISGGAAARTYNWRIYPGTCSSPGTDVVGGSTQAYAPLITNAAGTASVSRLFPSALYLVASSSYNVRVLTGTAISTTVACGNLQRS